MEKVRFIRRMEADNMSIEVVIAGGGWAGCAAAYGAVLQGAKVTLLEKNGYAAWYRTGWRNYEK